MRKNRPWILNAREQRHYMAFQGETAKTSEGIAEATHRYRMPSRSVRVCSDVSTATPGSRYRLATWLGRTPAYLYSICSPELARLGRHLL